MINFRRFTFQLTISAYKDANLSIREIARKISRLVTVVRNFQQKIKNQPPTKNEEF